MKRLAITLLFLGLAPLRQKIVDGPRSFQPDHGVHEAHGENSKKGSVRVFLRVAPWLKFFGI